ncbi:DHHW family protein [Exiguobacterium sp. AM39-5BH]|uniref:DHHW family protein n=1 Tax=Exiguobacterium sp. AM39-5BH TaxID=2292355 RepID=UPI000FE25617|nr:DHHW family protein [Exiguobacterium sp. AM39-5BH]RHB49657.1 hypothetical protein DW881_07670 [Exiguobacterium sp. AM39-5BH]
MKRLSSTELKHEKKRKLSWVTNSFIFFGFIGILFYGLTVFAFGTEEATSDIEGRSLEERPTFSPSSFLNGTYMETFEASANDQVFQRDFWIESQSWFQRNILRQAMNNGVINVDGMLLSPETNASEYSSLGVFMKDFKAEMDEVDIPVYFASAPSKPVYATRRDLFPPYVQSVDAANRGELHQRIEEADISLIDLEKRLGEYEGGEIYFMTDHHWRAEGAFKAYEQIMSELGDVFPDADALDFGDMETKQVDGPFYGSSAREISISYVEDPDTFTYLEPKDGFTTTVCRNGDDCGYEVLDRDVLDNTTDFTNYYNIFMGDNYAQATITQEKPKNDYHLLVLKDSYANPVLGYLGESFGKVTALDVRYFEDYPVDISEYAKENDVDGVLFLHNDRISGLGSTYQKNL